MENNLLKTDYPIVQSILNVPLVENPVPYTVSGNNPSMKNYGVYKDFRNQYPTYCNSLPPPPRDQIQYNKYLNQKRCAYLQPKAFTNNECYFLEGNPTGPVNGKVGGYFCGGAPNNNSVRGNEFGLNYPFNNTPVQDFNVSTQQPSNLQYYDTNLNLREFKNDYKLIENDINYKTYPYNRLNTIIYKKQLN